MITQGRVLVDFGTDRCDGDSTSGTTELVIGTVSLLMEVGDVAIIFGSVSTQQTVASDNFIHRLQVQQPSSGQATDNHIVEVDQSGTTASTFRNVMSNVRIFEATEAGIHTFQSTLTRTAGTGTSNELTDRGNLSVAIFRAVRSPS